MKKKLIGMMVAAILAMGILVPTVFAAPKVPNPDNFDIGSIERIADMTGAGFHCNHGTGSGNGRVWPAEYDVVGKAHNKVPVQIIYLADNSWLLDNNQLYTEYGLENGFVCPTCGNNVWVSYSNKSGVPNGKNMQFTNYYEVPEEPETPPQSIDASLFFDKFVGVTKLDMWLTTEISKGVFDEIYEDGMDYAALIDILMSFTLCKVEGDDDTNYNLANGWKAAYANNGRFSFNAEFETGRYVIVETLTEIGKKFFKTPEPLYVNVVVDEVNGLQIPNEDNDLNTFNYDAFYTIVNGYGRPDKWVLGYPGLNNGGDIFYIGLTDITTGTEYATFCANAGSRNFAGESGLGCAGYLVVDKDDQHFEDRFNGNFDKFISAYNFIEDMYGSLNDNRAITQVVTWALLGAIDVESDAFWAIQDSRLDKEKVVEVLAAAEAGYKGEGRITDLVYLTCEHHHNVNDCQPQILPVYGRFTNIQNMEVGA